ncbi:M1 family metallopeptidase [Kitasatospora sp. NPDC001664]
MRTRLTLAAAAAAVLLLAQPATAGTAPYGSAGVGDPYYPDYGNGGYDVSHYDLRLTYQPATDQLSGTATILATTTEALARFNLDFALAVQEVQVNGRQAKFAATGDHELEITPAAPLAKGKKVTVVVRYSDVPSSRKVYGWTGWQRTPDGGVAANEPEGSWWWYPSNDHPTDKATFDVSVAVPDGTQVISNGALVGQSSKLGWTRYSWRQTKPQATYLATLAVGRFDLDTTTTTTAAGVPVITAYSRDLGEYEGAARASLERTGEITDWLATQFGPYPFATVGGYVPNVPTRYALETQGQVFYSPKVFAAGSNTSVVAHELAHQWYGDSVSLERWSDIWLNEGFARYAQWLWSEHEGEGTAQELADWTYASRPADDPWWQVLPGDPGADNQFHSAVYDRGALAVQALRNAVGEQAFFAILRGWPTEHRLGNASLADFRSYAERISGKPLSALLDSWLLTPGRPAPGTATTPAASSAPQGLAKAAAPQEPRSWKQIKATDSLHAGH